MCLQFTVSDDNNVLSRKESWLTAVKLGIAGALLVYTYQTQKVFVPLFLVGFFGLLWWKKPQLRKMIVIAGTVFSVVISPMMWLTISQPDVYNVRFQLDSIFNKVNPAVEFVSQYNRYFSYQFLFGKGDPWILHQVPRAPTFPLVMLIPMLVGVYVCLQSFVALFRQKHTDHKQINDHLHLTFLLWWIIISPLPGSLTDDPYHLNRIIHLLPILTIVNVIGLSKIAAFIGKYFHKKVVCGVLAIIFLATIIHYIAFSIKYWGIYQSRIEFSFPNGLAEAFTILRSQSCHVWKIDSNYNQAYIYYLFYSKIVPDQSLYKDIQRRKEGGFWATVPQIGQVIFGPISTQDLAFTKKIESSELLQTGNQVFIAPLKQQCLLKRI